MDPGSLIWTFFETLRAENVGESEAKVKLLMESGKVSLPVKDLLAAPVQDGRRLLEKHYPYSRELS